MEGTGFMSSLASRIQPTGVGRTIEDPVLLARIAVGSGVMLAVNIALLAGIHGGFGEWQALAIDLGAAAVYLAGFVVFLVTGSIARFAAMGLWWTVVTVPLSHAILGGYVWSGGYVLWGIVNATLAALWLERRQAIVIASIWMVAAVVLVPMESMLQERRDPPDELMAVLTLALIFVTSLLLVVPTALLLVFQIFTERSKTRALMLNILPAALVPRLRDDPGVIADRFDDCTVVFTDLVGFTEHSRHISPDQLVAELNAIFSEFDRIVAEAGGEKIKTIGDGYMAGFGVPEPLDEHATVACRVAVDMLVAVDEANRTLGTDYSVRIGVASGPVVAGVIGSSKFAYDLWGDTVNLAARLEQAADADAILVSAAVRDRAHDAVEFAPVGELHLKGGLTTVAYAVVR